MTQTERRKYLITALLKEQLMRKQGCEEQTGRAKITPAFNLPCKYLLYSGGNVQSSYRRRNCCNDGRNTEKPAGLPLCSINRNGATPFGGYTVTYIGITSLWDLFISIHSFLYYYSCNSCTIKSSTAMLSLSAPVFILVSAS